MQQQQQGPPIDLKNTTDLKTEWWCYFQTRSYYYVQYLNL